MPSMPFSFPEPPPPDARHQSFHAIVFLFAALSLISRFCHYFSLHAAAPPPLRDFIFPPLFSLFSSLNFIFARRSFLPRLHTRLIISGMVTVAPPFFCLPQRLTAHAVIELSPDTALHRRFFAFDGRRALCSPPDTSSFD
jgi:hypothetical protein